MMTLTDETDVRIYMEVLEELAWDARLPPGGIGATVRHRVVTLTGIVDSWARRLAAQAAARRVAGVLDVVNDIHVSPPGVERHDDAELAERVRLALQWDALVPDEQIRTTVHEGRVVLEGDVDTWAQRQDAEAVVQRLGGVVHVENQIEVAPKHVLASIVQQHVTEALARHAAREAGRIRVEVRDGTATVTGIVDSWAEREAVLGAVRGTRGVRRVEQDLRIA